MENRDMEDLMRDLIGAFAGETGFYETVYDWYYATVAASFKDEVDDYCKVVIFGDEYAMSVQKLYDYDPCLAIEEWHNFVSRSLEEDFHDWAEQSIGGAIEDFATEFQQWLAGRGRNDERASSAIVALMGGDIDLAKIIVGWICDRLPYGDWKYPA